jgi:hypothetical protein
VNWNGRVVLFSLDDGDAVAVPMPKEWLLGWVDLSILMNGLTSGIVKLLETSYVPALVPQPQPTPSQNSIAADSMGQWLCHPSRVNGFATHLVCSPRRSLL